MAGVTQCEPREAVGHCGPARRKQLGSKGSLAKYRALKADLLNSSEDGWLKTVVTVPGVPGYSGTVKVEFHHVNLATWLEEEFSNKAYTDNFVLLPREQWRDGSRVFNGPHTGDVWLDHQDSLPPDGRPLRDWSYCGKVMADPWGRSCLVFPRFFSFVHDSPEAMDMLCVRGGSKSTYEARTEEDQQAVFGRLADASLTANARSQLSQHESTQPVASGLWGWAGLPGSSIARKLSTSFDPISMTPSILLQSTGFDDPWKVSGGHPTYFDQLRPPSIAIDPISMTPSNLQKSTGFDDPGENVRRGVLTKCEPAVCEARLCDACRGACRCMVPNGENHATIMIMMRGRKADRGLPCQAGGIENRGVGLGCGL
ncbi:hypothetical protein HaLaN_07907 [Haematococcus lacustris]|uniref:Uncharacterized protein n=1 Tax=Haematococcus lacustris TaxID=44745 RepID=A0A699Z039_HAELA|nr:hypothetical protein HaLaN_07907 [Haematococcus lacustris]